MNKNRIIVISLIFACPWILVMFLFRYFSGESLSRGVALIIIASGLLAGVIFSMIMKYLSQRLPGSIRLELPDGEVLIMEEGANHFKGPEAVGGKLFLTDKHLIFKSHPYNVQNYEEFFPLNEVSQIIPYKTLGMLRNGLKIKLYNTQEHRFVVNNRTKWVSEITKYLNDHHA